LPLGKKKNKKKKARRQVDPLKFRVTHVLTG